MYNCTGQRYYFLFLVLLIFDLVKNLCVELSFGLMSKQRMFWEPFWMFTEYLFSSWKVSCSLCKIHLETKLFYNNADT